MAHQIVQNYFSHVSEHYFPDLVNCLATYASSRKDPELAVKAIKSLKLCAKKLADCTLEEGGKETENFGDFFFSPVAYPSLGKPSDEVLLVSESSSSLESRRHVAFQKWGNQWLSLVNAFVRTILTAAVDNRRIALNTLFSVLKTEGSEFDCPLWKYLFENGIWHLFDKLRTVTADTKVTDSFLLPPPPSLSSPLHLHLFLLLTSFGSSLPFSLLLFTFFKEDWLLTESSDLFKALHGVISLFDTYFSVISSLLGDVLALMATFIESSM
jgi:hypothetical protein